MRKTLFIILIFITGLILSCGDLFLDPEPIGRINPDDPEFTGTITGRPEIKITGDFGEINNNDTITLFEDTEAYDTRFFVIHIQNISSDTVLSLTGDPRVVISGKDAEMFSIDQQPATSIAAGDVSGFTVYFTPESEGVKTAVLTIACNDDDESSFVINISATAVFNPLGTALADDFADAGGGLVEIITDSYLAPRETTAAAILIDGAVSVKAGVTLTIYSGVTLDMGNYSIIVDGSFYVEGSDDNRVKFSGSNWGGITINGNADINGAVIQDYNSEAGFGIRVSGSDVTVTNCRFVQQGTSNGIQIVTSGPGAGFGFCFQNNIFIDINDGGGNQPCIEFQSSISNDIRVCIWNNTFVGKSNNGTAIDISESNNSVYDIYYNIFANATSSNTYNPVIQIDSLTPKVYAELNVYDDDALFWAGYAPVKNYNLQLAGWDSNTVFNDLSSDDYRMKQTTTYPDLLQANYIEELEGCLTNGHANEAGAYGNGGYPPDYNE